MRFTKADVGPYYDFFAEKDGKRYIIRTDEHKVVSVLIEYLNSCHRETYQRGPEMARLGLTIDQNIMEQALLAICQNSLERWAELYRELWNDSEYARPMMEVVFKKHFYL